jgi:TatD DNase family protein
MSKKARPPIPQLNGRIIETHCHLDYLSGEEIESTMAKSRSVGIDRVITIAVSRDNQQVVQKIASQYDDVWCTQGLHPHEADTWDSEFNDELKQCAGDQNVVAVGEIGPRLLLRAFRPKDTD